MSYKQQHAETCLAKCLQILLNQHNQKDSAKKEIELLVYSLKHSRENIARGHIEKILKENMVKINWVVDSKIFYNYTKRKKLPKNINIKLEKINIKNIDKINKPLILYLDRWCLWKKKQSKYYKYHWPHFIIVNKVRNKTYQIIDPDDGKIKIINKIKIGKGVRLLKYHIWLSPMIISVEALY